MAVQGRAIINPTSGTAVGAEHEGRRLGRSRYIGAKGKKFSKERKLNNGRGSSIKLSMHLFLRENAQPSKKIKSGVNRRYIESAAGSGSSSGSMSHSY